MPDISPLPPSHPEIATGKKGILLIQLGTPQSPSPNHIRRYLAQFLSDKRVIELPALFWQPLLRCVILPLRSQKLSHSYKTIWDKKHNESPLRQITKQQAEKVNAKFPTIEIEYAMRYGAPSIEEKLQKLQKMGCEQISLIALYPQYSATTTASSYDESFRILQKMRWQPSIRTAASWHDDKIYIEALAAHLKKELGKLSWKPEVILASFHGLPEHYLHKGDPYHCHCAKTARLLRQAMNMSEETLRLCFQSRFGRAKWLEPYTQNTVETLAKEGVKKIAVITPGFTTDCLETLEEINIMLKKSFLDYGGKKFHALPCLNDNQYGIKILEHIIKREIGDWL